MRSHVSDNRMILNSPSLYFLKGNTSLCALNFKTNIYIYGILSSRKLVLPSLLLDQEWGKLVTNKLPFLGWNSKRERERCGRRTHQIHHLPFLPRLKNKNPYPFLEFPYPPRKLKSPSVQESTIFPEKICKKGRNRERSKDIPLEIPKKKKTMEIVSLRWKSKNFSPP